jgi:hypothetical protein
MRRIISVLAVVAAMVAVMAVPAFAKNSQDQPPGPPLFSGGNSTLVVHCNSEEFGGTRGVVVFNKNDVKFNNCDFF